MAEPKATPPSPGPPSRSLPSSFDSDPEFFEESRSGKLFRRLREEPLIPLGCAATCYALYQATKSMQSGDHHQTNRMFRARVYAQGFTLLAIVGGSIFWKDERMKRKEFRKVVEEKQAAEKKEKWVKELEARDQEDRDWRAKFEGVAQRAKEAEEGAKNKAKGIKGKLLQRTKPVEDGIEKRGDAAKGELNKGSKETATGEDRAKDAKIGKEQGRKDEKEGERRVGEAKAEAFETKSVLEQASSSQTE